MLINWANNLNNKVITNKSNLYYIAFKAGSKSPKDLTILEQTLNCPGKEANEQREAIVKEYKSLKSKSTQKTIKRSSLPKGIKVLGTKLVFKTKRNKNRDIIYRKACLIIRGFEQVHSRDFDQTFASIYKLATQKLTLALIARLDLRIV